MERKYPIGMEISKKIIPPCNVCTIIIICYISISCPLPVLNHYKKTKKTTPASIAGIAFYFENRVM